MIKFETCASVGNLALQNIPEIIGADVQGIAEMEGEGIEWEDDNPEAYGVYLIYPEGEVKLHVWVADFKDKHAADALAGTINMIIKLNKAAHETASV